MKALVRFLTLCLLVSFMASCGAPAAPMPAATQPPKPADTAVPAQAPEPTNTPEPTKAPEPTLSAAEEWAKANGFGPYQPATEDWAAVEAAARKEGSVMVYANSSRFEQLLPVWEAKYPGIKLDGGDTDGIDTKMREEQLANNVVGDIWYNSDGNIMYGEFVPKQWLWSYVPPGVVIPEVTAQRPFAIARHGTDVIGYNTELHPDGCPLTNWWQLTEPALKGKVFMEDPVSNVSMTALIATVIQHGDELAAAYKELYGRDYTTDEAYGPDAFGMDTPDAGWLWARKMAQNKPGIQPGGSEVDESYALPGMNPNEEPGYGISGYSSMEDTADGKLVFAPCVGIKPVLGIFKTTYLAVATNAPHPNASKLFIKFVLSDEGRFPWNVVGDYPAVEGQSVAEGAIPLKDLKVWTMDDAYIYQNNSRVRDFWAVSLLYAPEE